MRRSAARWVHRRARVGLLPCEGGTSLERGWYFEVRSPYVVASASRCAPARVRPCARVAVGWWRTSALPSRCVASLRSVWTLTASPSCAGRRVRAAAGPARRSRCGDRRRRARGALRAGERVQPRDARVAMRALPLRARARARARASPRGRRARCRRIRVEPLEIAHTDARSAWGPPEQAFRVASARALRRRFGVCVPDATGPAARSCDRPAVVTPRGVSVGGGGVEEAFDGGACDDESAAEFDRGDVAASYAFVGGGARDAEELGDLVHGVGETCHR